MKKAMLENNATKVFEVLGAPQGKARARVCVRNGFARAYTPEKTASYENLIKLSYINSCGKSEVIPTEKPIRITVTAFYPMPKNFSKIKQENALKGLILPSVKPDLDNVVKVICDALNGIAFKDDSKVVQILAQKFYGISPKVNVEIKEVFQL